MNIKRLNHSNSSFPHRNLLNNSNMNHSSSNDSANFNELTVGTLRVINRMGINESMQEIKSMTERIIINGSGTHKGWYTVSDKRVKTFINDVDTNQCLQNINQLALKKYEYKPSFRHSYGLDKDIEHGVYAQDLEKIKDYKSLVKTQSTKLFYGKSFILENQVETIDDMKRVDYDVFNYTVNLETQHVLIGFEIFYAERAMCSFNLTVSISSSTSDEITEYTINVGRGANGWIIFNTPSEYKLYPEQDYNITFKSDQKLKLYQGVDGILRRTIVKKCLRVDKMKVINKEPLVMELIGCVQALTRKNIELEKKINLLYNERKRIEK